MTKPFALGRVVLQPPLPRPFTPVLNASVPALMFCSMNVRWIGRIGFADALELQESLRAGIEVGIEEETFLLLEHDPIYTIGRTIDRSSLGDPSLLPHPLLEINRGGQATYHGPGQLVGYALLDLNLRGRDLHRHLRSLEEVLITLLIGLGIEATRRPGLTGVWVADRKIASIGVGVRKWITMHGFALNVSQDLTAFSHITPCGISNVAMTSVEKETDRGATVESTAAGVVEHIRNVLG